MRVSLQLIWVPVRIFSMWGCGARIWRTRLKIGGRLHCHRGIRSACLPDSDTRAVFPKGDIPGTDDVQRNFVECWKLNDSICSDWNFFRDLRLFFAGDSIAPHCAIGIWWPLTSVSKGGIDGGRLFELYLLIIAVLQILMPIASLVLRRPTDPSGTTFLAHFWIVSVQLLSHS